MTKIQKQSSLKRKTNP